jgi:hypothetical protein
MEFLDMELSMTPFRKGIYTLTTAIKPASSFEKDFAA